MATDIKTKILLWASAIIVFTLSLISSFALTKNKSIVCKKIKNEISMCDFYVYSKKQKLICINNVKRKYGTQKFQLCK